MAGWLTVDNFEWHLELEEPYVRFVLDKSSTDQVKAVVTPGSRETSGLCQFMSEMRYDTTIATKEVMQNASTLAVKSLQKPNESYDTS